MSEYSVTLISPSGQKFVSRSPNDTNDLVYGQGYRRAEEADAEQAQAESKDSSETP